LKVGRPKKPTASKVSKETTVSIASTVSKVTTATTEPAKLLLFLKNHFNNTIHIIPKIKYKKKD